MSEIYIGLMSGTSVDGIDAVAVDFSDHPWRCLGSDSIEIPEDLRERILNLCVPGFNEIERMQEASNQLSKLYAELVLSLIKKINKTPSEIRALGAHGQTIRHRPEHAATTQMFNGSLMAELTGIDTVCDFRTRDVAAGGQGAPLVPPFHAAWFAQEAPTAVLNLGGIANVTVVDGRGSEVIGFDCGPANMLMDAWIFRHLHKRFDRDGQWASTGKVNPELLNKLLAEPYFERELPKSTGRELFNLEWLDGNLIGNEKPEDVQATLLELTARSSAEAIMRFAPKAQRAFLCGGGALNKRLFLRFRELLPHLTVARTDEKGLNTQEVEGAAFAWLAYAFIHKIPANAPSVTGSKGKRILGCLYPA